MKSLEEFVLRITILAAGSRGDIQPYVALGIGLKTAGFDVNIATHAYFERFVRSRGLDFSLLSGNPRQILSSGSGQEWLESNYRPLAFMKRMYKALEPLIWQMMNDCLEACRGSQAVMFGVISAFAGLTIAEKLGIQAIPALKQHVHPTRDYPCGMVMPSISLGRWYNRLTYPIGYQIYWQVLRSLVNRWRTALDMPPQSLQGPIDDLLRRRLPCLYGFSPHVIPRPSEWGDEVYINGYWMLEEEEDWSPPEDLLRFLDRGPQPVYIGFGSMHTRNAIGTACVALEALQITGQRGVLMNGWSGIADGLSQYGDASRVFGIDFAPHEWLFPRMALVVHHGGSGTTAAGLKAGKPSVLVPFFADQPYWGWHVQRLKVGPRPIPSNSFNVQRLVEALETVMSDPQMQERAAQMGEKLCQENGVQNAVHAVQKILW